ncbi:class I SAM-dependent methyltransferase [Gordonia rhizosphera]|uniref:Putative methyltransferase n=1 Tax=Gordonia rhizosphera NBRC 16068 TaxID=1108045 RepID=K6WFE0_9ACTN|nr:class I SAM-dependent methyltransferase [Gordonia rhizosphera]GAB92481.1 putative methyltransferase [Gordonia rhizosphera NBRC 16068]
MSCESDGKTIYESAPTTDRNAELLAKRHHFDSLDSLIDYLPRHANVLDVGAGLSNLGTTVAGARPDVRWINFDFGYSDPFILDRARADAPGNISFVAGDATRISQTLPGEEFDAVFSYWMFPHLSIDSELPAENAARQIYRVAKQDALISIGPKTDMRLFPLLHEKESFLTYKESTLHEDEFSKEVVLATKLGPLVRYISRINNSVAAQAIGTTVGIQRDGFVLRVYDRQTNTYVGPFTHSGSRIIGSIATAACRYVVRNPPHFL